MREAPQPPLAERRPVAHVDPGEGREDEYAWLRDRDDPGVVAHLEAENAYTEAVTASQASLRDRLFEEIRARVLETDTGAPVPHGPWFYYTRTEAGLQYPILCRRRRDPVGADAGADGPSDEQVILDQNALAEGHDHLHVGDAEVSPDHRILAYTVDLSGAERHTLRFRDLESGEDLAGTVDDVYYSLAWASDSRTILYTRVDSAMRPHRVLLHTLGTDPAGDRVVLQEDDERFFAAVARSRSGRRLVITLASHITSEVHLVDAADPEAPPRLVSARRQGIEYTVEHHVDGAGREHLYIVTNDGARNFRLVETALLDPGHHNWVPVLAHDDRVRLEGCEVFASHLALHERAGGLRRIRVVHLPVRGDPVLVEQPESVCTVTPGDNREWSASTVRFHYESLTTPLQTVDYDVVTRERAVVKEQPVLGGYDRTRYVTEQVWAPAPDGVAVPMSLVYRVGVARDGTAPALLIGYGAYEYSYDPKFSVSRLSLLDRGMVFGIAHVRGGGEMGRTWYEDGKLLRKPNTFTDFVACAEMLVSERFTSPDRLGIRGRSAGGLLIGAVLNLRPDLFGAVVAEVPFVDVLNTMSDPTLPLTVIEYEEWGNPAEPEYHEAVRGYSPYDNIEDAHYPAVLATGGLNDPRVGFWEPAKWVQRLREHRAGGGPILLRTKLGAGHAGASGRYDAWRDEAFVLAFLLHTLPGWEDIALPVAAAAERV